MRAFYWLTLMPFKITLILLFLFSLPIYAQEPNAGAEDLLFKGVIKQSHDNSCGIAALSTLINGTIENSHVSEQDVINTIKEQSNNVGEEGYSLRDLKIASEKMGYPAEWRKVSDKVLPKIKQPVIVLIGLNTDFPHFVVLKGIENNMAYLADSIRGNIRIPYDELIKDGINEKYPKWYVMAINPSPNKPKDSNLYLSANESERIQRHMTAEQSNLITLTTIAQMGQLIVDYGFNASLGSDKRVDARLNSESYENTLFVSYGITKSMEVGGTISYDLNRQKNDATNTNSTIIANGENTAYSLFVKNRFAFDESNKTGIVAGIRGSFIESRKVVKDMAQDASVFGGGVNALFYTNTRFAQIILGGNVSKQFSDDKAIDDVLPQYQVSGYISANKPFADRYLGSLSFSVFDGHNKSGVTQEFPQSYAVTTSVSYVLSKQFQISPSFSYGFGNGDIFSFGIDIAYMGRW